MDSPRDDKSDVEDLGEVTVEEKPVDGAEEISDRE